jgi:ATP-dependent Clp protease ATP-binding subunit ClpB
VMFKPLGKEQIRKIVALLLAEFCERLKEQGVDLALDDSAVSFIADEGFDSVYGARPLKRFIQRHVETPVARQIVAGDIADGSHVALKMEDGALALVNSKQS